MRDRGAQCQAAEKSRCLVRMKEVLSVLRTKLVGLARRWCLLLVLVPVRRRGGGGGGGGVGGRGSGVECGGDQEPSEESNNLGRDWDRGELRRGGKGRA